MKSPFFSICIPAYNRARYLSDLLDSIFVQDFHDYEILIAEDCSPERDEICNIVNSYNTFKPIRLILNKENLGYDKNIRVLIDESLGKYLLFLGNDDLLADGALRNCSELLESNPSATCAIRAYAVFKNDISNPEYNVHYFKNSQLFCGDRKYSIGVRRFGVLSGLIFLAEIAKSTITSKYDGGLYYQTYVGIECLKKGDLLYINRVVTFSRDGIAPDFGNSKNENSYTPGSYTSLARFKMISGVTNIIKSALNSEGSKIINLVLKDYSTYMYPFFKDQLYLGLRQYIWLWFSVGKLGYSRFLRYHILIWIAYILKPKGMNLVAKAFRFVRGK